MTEENLRLIRELVHTVWNSSLITELIDSLEGTEFGLTPNHYKLSKGIDEIDKILEELDKSKMPRMDVAIFPTLTVAK